MGWFKGGRITRNTAIILHSCVHVNLKAQAYFPLVSQDYKTYLDFVLALENRKEPAALQYIFKLLDIEEQGYLNVFSLNYFFRVPDALTRRRTRHTLMNDA